MMTAAQAVKAINETKFRNTNVIRWLCGLIEKEIILFDQQPLVFPNDEVKRTLMQRQMIVQLDGGQWCLDETVLQELLSRPIASSSPPPPPSSRNPASKKRKKGSTANFTSDKVLQEE